MSTFPCRLQCMILATVLGAAIAAAAEAQDAPAQAAAADETRARAAVLDSSEWRRAMFEVDEWFRTQQVYTPAEVEEVRIAFRGRVAGSTADELKLILADLQAKLAIMESPQAREARAWMAEYVAVMSDSKREQVLGELPNLSTLTSRQLHDELVRIKGKRARIDQKQAAFGNRQAGKVAARSQQLAASQASQAPANRPRPAAGHSPYRPSSNVNDRLNSSSGGNRPSFFVNTLGGVGRALPGAW